MRPEGPPIGVQLTQTARRVGRAFNKALMEAGGSIPVWLVLNALVEGQPRTQLDVARAIGIEGPTLVRHIDGMEAAGLLERQRDQSDRRAVRLELSVAGRELHRDLLGATIAFNRQLLAGFAQPDIAALRRLLSQLDGNASADR